MIQYLASFIVYTLAMIGVLVIGFVVYKKTITSTPGKKNSMLKVVDVLRLPDRKTLYVINCRNEQFLIASSNDKITLISKLNEKSGYRENELQIEKYLNEKLEDSEFNEMNNPYINRETKNKKYVIKSLLKELSDKNQTKRGNY